MPYGVLCLHQQVSIWQAMVCHGQFDSLPSKQLGQLGLRQLSLSYHTTTKIHIYC